MGWIEHYLQLAQHTEPPKEFQVWCAIAELGHVLGRKVWLDQFSFKIFPGQMMVLLCSDSAVARKTTAMRGVGRLIETLSEADRNIIPQRVSSATLLDAMNRVNEQGEQLDAIGLIFAEELGTFFSREHARQDLPTLVTELNDAKEGLWQAPTRTYGTVVLKNPCLGMIAGITPTGLAKEVPEQIRRTGFLGRCIVVHAKGTGTPQPLTKRPPYQQKLEAWLQADLMRLAALKGEFTWSAEGSTWFESWYLKHFSEASLMKSTLAQSGWMARKHVHLLRVAIILTAAERSELVLQVDMLEKALTLLDHVQRKQPQAMAQVGVAAQQERKDLLLEKLVELSTKSGNGSWVDIRRLYGRVHRRYKDYADLEVDLLDWRRLNRAAKRANPETKREEWRAVLSKGEMLQLAEEKES